MLIQIEKTAIGSTNTTNNSKPLSGVKNASISKDYPLDIVKQEAKLRNATLNDLITSAIGVSFKEHFEAKGDITTNEVTAVTIFSFRQKPK